MILLLLSLAWCPFLPVCTTHVAQAGVVPVLILDVLAALDSFGVTLGVFRPDPVQSDQDHHKTHNGKYHEEGHRNGVLNFFVH